MSLAATLFPLLRPVLRRLDPEQAHRLALAGLRLLPAPAPAPGPPELAVRALGLDFANPLGLAAGFDKNAEVPDQMLGLGFGFVEVGSVTPLPQEGNPRPRLFRLEPDRAVINRMGFNNDGHAAVLRRLAARRGRSGPVGVNVGANKDSADRIADYALGVAAFAALADYLVINVSSPNTLGLRGLQAGDELRRLLPSVMAARDGVPSAVPVLLKIAPDLADAELAAIIGLAISHGLAGLIVANTTLARPALRSPLAAEPGGLSGAPLFGPATRMLAQAHLLAAGKLLLIGAGGVSSAADALAKIEAGASLVQLYSALVFAGPGLVPRLIADLALLLRRRGVTELGPLVGSRAAELALPRA